MVGNKNQQKEEMKHGKHQNWEALLSFHYPWPLEKALCDLLSYCTGNSLCNTCGVSQCKLSSLEEQVLVESDPLTLETGV